MKIYFSTTIAVNTDHQNGLQMLSARGDKRKKLKCYVSKWTATDLLLNPALPAVKNEGIWRRDRNS
jgi:hypothetical protein